MKYSRRVCFIAMFFIPLLILSLVSTAVKTEAYNPNVKTKKMVLGYYAEDYQGDKLSYNSLLNNSSLINNVAFFNYLVDQKGNLTTGQPVSQGLKLAESKGVKSLALVHNMGKYNMAQTAHQVLSVEKNRKNLENNILLLVKGNGFDGVNIDLEGVPPGDRAFYNKFLVELKQMFKPYGYLLTVSIPAKTADNPFNSWNGAYDYRTIGVTADLVALMTYDEHWKGGPPGPVASLPWVQKVLDYSIKNIPREKVLMGIPAYGYNWSAAGNTTVHWNKTAALTAKYPWVRWNDYYSLPYLVYYDEKGVKHEVWFENKYSLRIKLDLANNYGIAGIALWRLGFEDASFWETLRAKFS
jgi:spore germination protein YaaH